MRQTPHTIAELRRRALAELGVIYDELPPLLRPRDIHRGARSNRGRSGILPISARTFYSWVAQGLIPPATKFENGISAWPKPVIIKLALDGIRREPGHGRKLPHGTTAEATLTD